MDKIIIILILMASTTNISCQNKKTDMKYNKLSSEEKRVIIDKGTERPFVGIYDTHYETGIYKCKQCDTPLFKSDNKFDAECGWPAFEDAIQGAVKEVPDKDGMRTEIICANCGGHLGHVFVGEGFTPTNTRHCVNSISLNFEPLEITTNDSIKYETAIFAAGCFWGVEHHLKLVPGVISTEVGYIGGHSINPTYEEVCNKNTGHAEAVQVVFDPNKTSFEDLAKLFFEIHDPGQLDRQGPDIGSQYRSEVFYTNEKQKEITENLIQILKQKGYKPVTRLTPAGKFYLAEKYHQDYYSKTGSNPYCHFYKKKF